MRIRRFASICIVLALGVLGFAPALVGAASAARNGSLGPGCAPDRPAVAHYAEGVVATGRHGHAPIPCMTRTGFPTSEVSIAVTNRAAILFNPVIAADGSQGLTRSVDGGQSWQFVPHAANGAPVTVAIDQNLWVDRRSGRAFWVEIDNFPSPTPLASTSVTTTVKAGLLLPNPVRIEPTGPWDAGIRKSSAGRQQRP
jgi:hypothetical protein